MARCSDDNVSYQLQLQLQLDELLKDCHRTVTAKDKQLQSLQQELATAMEYIHKLERHINAPTQTTPESKYISDHTPALQPYTEPTNRTQQSFLPSANNKTLQRRREPKRHCNESSFLNSNEKRLRYDE